MCLCVLLCTSPHPIHPILQVEVITPEDHMGDVIGDLNSRRGMVNKFDDKPGGMKLVQAYVPLAEMFNYVSTLRGMTKGRANYRWVGVFAAQGAPAGCRG